MSAYKYYEDDFNEDRTEVKPFVKAQAVSAAKQNYRYNEDELLREITKYIDATYGEHYSQTKFQSTEFIIDGGHGIGFTVGNIMKYAQRYGRKGSASDWRKDLLKVIHYAVIALYIHDQEHHEKA